MSSTQCANPSCSNAGTLVCAGCAEVKYCCKDCQKTHWAAHKTLCKAAPRSVDRMKESELRAVLSSKAESYENRVKRNTLLSKAENPAESLAALRALAKEHIQQDGAELDALLLAAQAKQKKRDARLAAQGAAQTTRQSARAGAIRPPATFSPSTANATPSPEQLRQQAAFMRKNPAAVRNAQAAFASLSDAQILAYADQLDQAANDPSMMREVERMAALSEEDKKLVQSIQQGLGGGMPITDEWITELVRAVQKKPELFKTMFGGKGAFVGGGITDEQVNSYIDMLSGMSEWLLKAIAYGVWYIASAAKPLTALYQTVDSYTLGSARYIVLALVAFVLYYVSMFLFLIGKFVVAKCYALYLLATSSSGAAASTAASAVSAATESSAAASTAASVAAKVAAAGANAAAQAAVEEF